MMTIQKQSQLLFSFLIYFVQIYFEQKQGKKKLIFPFKFSKSHFLREEGIKSNSLAKVRHGDTCF